MKTLFVEETVNKIGQEVELYGWVDSKRDHKKIIFIDLRDRTGIVQVVGDEKFKGLNSEDIIHVKGLVKKRPEKLINPKLKTGKIEIEAKEFKIISNSKPAPIPVSTDGYEIDEEIRLKYTIGMICFPGWIIGDSWWVSYSQWNQVIDEIKRIIPALRKEQISN